MKFKKDGKMFEDIEELRRLQCKISVCGVGGNCTLFQMVAGKNCVKWCASNPAEAARLMGYEVVVEEPHICSTCCGCELEGPDIEDSPCPQWVKRPKRPETQANMDKKKPRICEVLGVEVEEKFRVESGSCILYPEAFIDGDGVVRASVGQAMDGMRICQLISGELRLVRKPRFTEQEVAVAKWLWNADEYAGASLVGTDDGDIYYCCTSHYSMPLSKEAFLSIQPGQSVRLSEIVGDV